jgi:zinc protease
VRSVLDTNWDCGYWAVRAGVKLSKLSEAMSVVKEEFLKLPDTITQVELARAKEYILGHLPLTLEDTMGVAQFLGMRALLTDEVRQPSEVVAEIKGITLEEVRKVAGEIITEASLRRVVVGPKGV